MTGIERRWIINGCYQVSLSSDFNGLTIKKPQCAIRNPKKFSIRFLMETEMNITPLARDDSTLVRLADAYTYAASVPDEARLTPEQAAVFLTALGLPIAVSTLAKWRCVRSDGPRFMKRGRAIIYTARDLRAFAEGA